VSTALSLGVGTINSLDYPEMSLTVDSHVAVLRSKHADTLRELAGVLSQVRTAMEAALHWKDILDASMGSPVNAMSFRSRLGWIAYERIVRSVFHNCVGYCILSQTEFKEDLNRDPLFRITPKHVRGFWRRVQQGLVPQPEFLTPEKITRECGIQRGLEGLAFGMLSLIQQRALSLGKARRDEGWIRNVLKDALRTIAIARHCDLTPEEIRLEPRSDPEYDMRPARLLQKLRPCFDHGCTELANDLRLGRSLPLVGAKKSALEIEFESLARSIGKARGAERFTLRPLSKLQALHRGKSGGDCSTDMIPIRALDPHHVFYAIYKGRRRMRGYIAVFEAYAMRAEGERERVLCIETINIPGAFFNHAQQDLLCLMDAVAQARGLTSPCVISVSEQTWNYDNHEVLVASRRFVEGIPVALYPADPSYWETYLVTFPNEGGYLSFARDRVPHKRSARSVVMKGPVLLSPEQGKPQGPQPDVRMLAPFDPEHEVLQPGTLQEAARIRALPQKVPITILRSSTGEHGFISDWPSFAP
jgi:hypothetical protein